MLDRVRSHVEGKIAAARLERGPFPHLIIEDFFPDDVYARIQQYNPFLHNTGREWMAKGTSAQVTSRTPYHARKQINFHEDDAFEAPPAEHAFWTGLKQLFLNSHWFEGLVFQKYPDFFRLRFGDLVDDADFPALFRKELYLQRHEPGYYIGPHTDIPTRVFTCIFAFAARPGFEEFGTELLAPKDRLARCWGNDHFAPDAFEVRKLAPYKPNNFLLFFKTRQSFHAVRDITDDVPNQRYGMQFQFYEPHGGIFHDLSVPDLMSSRRRTEAGNRVKRALKVIAGRS